MKNVHYAIRPFYIVSKILGAFAYSYDGLYCNGRLKLSVPGTLWSGLVVVAYVSLFIVNAFVREGVRSTSKILALAWGTSLTISFLTMLIAKICQMCKQKSLLIFMKKIDEIDANVRSNKFELLKS